MATRHPFVRHPLEIVMCVFRGIRIAFWSVAIFGGWILAMSMFAKDKKPTAGEQPDQPYFSRTLDTSKTRLRRLCRPTSFYIPMLSSILALIYAFRALEDHHISLPGTQEYQNTCPEGSRRTSTGAFVKLFAATVTTVGVYGHLSSLNGSRAWKFELFRAIEVSTNPLAPVISFSTVLWYGFIDLLRISPGPWSMKITLKYRLARLCGCRLNNKFDVDRNFSLSVVGPGHIEATPLKRDLKWVGRMLVLLILLGQYCQAAVLLIRRILSKTAAGVDYAMLLLVLSGLVALGQSITISLLNVSWTLESHVQPCTEALCGLPECASFKEEQGLPNTKTRAIVFGRDIALIQRRILYQLAGGYAQLSIVLQLRDSFWKVLMNLLTGYFIWQSSIYHIFSIDGLRGLVTDDREPQSERTMDPTSDQLEQPSETLPAPISEDLELQPLGTEDPTSDQNQSRTLPTPIPNGSQGPSNQQQLETPPAPVSNDGQEESESLTLFGVSLFSVFFIVGIAAIIWMCIMVIYQLFLLIAPCASLYTRIASETASWKNADPTKPCPQLWKDNLEDELWWF